MTVPSSNFIDSLFRFHNSTDSLPHSRTDTTFIPGMLMVPSAHTFQPRLASSDLASQTRHPARTGTTVTEGSVADLTLFAADARLEEFSAGLAGSRHGPTGWAPRYHRVSVQRLEAGSFELDDQFAEETRMPFVLVAFE